MIYENLFDEILIQPALKNVTGLKIISGYATSAMAFHHLEKLKTINSKIEIELIVGMCSSDGLSISNHKGFQSILESEYKDSFKCKYIYKTPQVHSKIYIWHNNNIPVTSFIGSANYTQNAFSIRQREAIAQISDNNLIEYYNLIEKDSIFCNHIETDELVKIYNDSQYYRNRTIDDKVENSLTEFNSTNVPYVMVSLLSSKTNDIQTTAGLNWGQRPGREPNQAYIQLSPDIYKGDFFPVRTNHFTVVTDDSKVFICTRAQKDENGQAIETPHNNSLLGEYFRNRLGLQNGAPITKDDLLRYGRTDVTFYKFDDENYYMDFSI